MSRKTKYLQAKYPDSIPIVHEAIHHVTERPNDDLLSMMIEVARRRLGLSLDQFTKDALWYHVQSILAEEEGE